MNQQQQWSMLVTVYKDKTRLLQSTWPATYQTPLSYLAQMLLPSKSVFPTIPA
jgi:hypothetical protein